VRYFGSSVYSGEPLRRLIERYADDAMISAIATEAAKGCFAACGHDRF